MNNKKRVIGAASIAAAVAIIVIIIIALRGCVRGEDGAGESDPAVSSSGTVGTAQDGGTSADGGSREVSESVETEITTDGEAEITTAPESGASAETTASAETSPNETVPAETKPAETKPAETKPSETKPAETTPAETKPAETKPAETTPAETKPAETKPSETTPAETKPAETDAPSVPSVPAAGASALTVKGTRLVNAKGEYVQLRGVSTHGIAWYPDYINKDCFRTLRDEWNVNVVRLAMYTAESGGYCTGGDKSYLRTLIDNGVRYATELGMYVIIDWHVLNDRDPNTYISEAEDFFASVSKKYGAQDNVLYEICNEPNGGVGWSAIKKYAERIIGVIRKNDPDAVIIVGTPNWSQYVDEAARDPIRGYDNIMYTLHFYAATHKEDLRRRMEAAVDAGLPIFVSEFGISDASGGGGIDTAEADKWIASLDRRGISYVAWNLSNKNETCALLKPGCSKKSGFTKSDLTPSGVWLYETLTGHHAPPDEPEPQPSVTEPPEETRPEPADTTTPPKTEPAPAGSVSFLSCGMRVTAEIRGSWEEGGVRVYQYELTLENISGADMTSWAVDVRFDGAVTLVNGWNGSYTADGTALHISSMDYNGSVAAGGTVSGVGFIVKGAAAAG